MVSLTVSLENLARFYFKDAIELRRKIHKNPEISGDEVETQKLIVDSLPKSFKVRKLAGTGVVADLVTDPSYPFLGFRADIDALRMQEETGKEFASRKPGVCHACGHDFHTASLLTLALMLDETLKSGMWSDWSYNIRLIFEPSEELPPGGAIHIISEGGLEGVKTLIGFHLWSQRPTGTILIPGGDTLINCSYSRRLRAEIIGKGGHAARPDLANDPVVIARDVMNALDVVREENKTSALDPILRTRLDDGGTAVNVIPERVIVEATVRTMRDETNAKLEQLLPERIQAAVLASNGQVKVEFPIGYQPIKNNPAVCDQIRRLVNDSGLPKGVTDPLMGGESFGHYAARVPSAFLMIGCGGTEKQVAKHEGPHMAMHHSGRFNPDEGCLENMLLCQLALALGWQF